MTTPNGPSAYEPNKYYIPSNLPSDAAGGMAEFASTDQTGWEKYIHDRENAKWKPTGTEIGQPLDLLNNLIQAVVSVFQGDVGPLEDLVDGVIRGIPIIGDIYSAITSAITGVTNPSGGGGILGFLGNFFSGFTKAAAGQNPGSGEGITSAISGIFNQQAAVANTASTAASAASAARTAVVAVSAQAVTMGALNEFQFQLNRFESVGTFTWTRPAPPTGWALSHYLVQEFNGGNGGGRPAAGAPEGGPGGLDGGSIKYRLEASQVGATETVVVGAGGSGATSTGLGGVGGTSSFSASSLRATRGIGILLTAMGAIRDESKPGRGGRGCNRAVTNVSSSGTATYDYTSGDDGEPSANADGATGGSNGGWLGGGATAATAPEVGGVYGDNSEYASGGGGGGGGGGHGSSAPPSAGAFPGGGGGGGAALAPGFPGATNGQPGGRGAVYIWTFFKEDS